MIRLPPGESPANWRLTWLPIAVATSAANSLVFTQRAALDRMAAATMPHRHHSTVYWTAGVLSIKMTREMNARSKNVDPFRLKSPARSRPAHARRSRGSFGFLREASRCLTPRVNGPSTELLPRERRGGLGKTILHGQRFVPVIG